MRMGQTSVKCKKGSPLPRSVAVASPHQGPYSWTALGFETLLLSSFTFSALLCMRLAVLLAPETSIQVTIYQSSHFFRNYVPQIAVQNA